MSEAAARWARVRRVLAVRLDNLGDVLMTTPALAALRAAFAPARLTLLASPGGAALAPMLPVVDDAIAFAAPWMANGVAAAGDWSPRPGAAEQAIVERLARERFDAAVVFTVCTQSALPAALLCRMAGIPLRLAHARENPYALLTDWVRETDVVAPGMRHEVERQLALVAAVGAHADGAADTRLRLAPPPAAVDALRTRLAALGVPPQRPLLVVHPGASAPSRRWPPERFGATADRIAARSGCTVVFTGDAAEAAAIAAARAQMTQRSLDLGGRLPLPELAALIADAALLLVNNTGPMHLAAALGTPVVALYALTNPQHQPWRVPSRVLSREVPCRDCLRSVCPQGHHACLRGVEVDEAVAAGLALLAERPRR